MLITAFKKVVLLRVMLALLCPTYGYLLRLKLE